MATSAPLAAVPAVAPIPCVVTAIEPLARSVSLFEVTPAAGYRLPPAEPGAHIGFILPDGTERSYSLVTAGDGADRSYRVAIKREEAGRGGSRWFHDELKPGAAIEIMPPRNHFPLDEQARETLLIAGGIGISPLWSMAQRLEALGRPWSMIYACRSRAEAAFLGPLYAFHQVSFHFDDEQGGAPLPMAAAVAAAPAEAHLYCCGPLPMLAAFEAAVAGRPTGHVHVEYFAPKEAPALDGGYTVHLAKSGKDVPIRAGQTILKALRNHGVEVPFSCEEGTCGACEVRVVSGQPDHRDTVLTDEERAGNKTMMVCCSGSCGPVLTLDL